MMTVIYPAWITMVLFALIGEGCGQPPKEEQQKDKIEEIRKDPDDEKPKESLPTVSPTKITDLYQKDKINSLKHVEDYMRKYVYTYENDKQKQNKELLPFFQINEVYKAALIKRSSLPYYNLWNDWHGVSMDKNGEYPVLWELRPDKSLTGDKLFGQIMALPTKQDKHTEAHYTVHQHESASKRRYYLKPDTEDNTVVDGKIVGKSQTDAWRYRGRKITPELNKYTWHIESAHPNFKWKLKEVPSNLTIEYLVEGVLHINGREYVRHPDSSFKDPNMCICKRPYYFGSMRLYSVDVFGWNSSYSEGFKKMSWMDALNVTINWIEHFERAYGVKQG